MKRFKNIGVLDLRKCSDELLRGVEKIESVGMLVYGEAQHEAIKHIKQVSIGLALSLPEGVEFVTQNGAYTLSRPVLEALNNKVVLMVNGKVTVDPIGDAELLGKLHKVTVNGKLVIREDDYAVLASRTQVNGVSMVYAMDEKFVEGTFVLNDVNLYGLDEGTKLFVDNISALDSFDEALFDETIQSFKVNHYLVASQKNIRKLARKISNYLEIEKYIVPDGFAYYESLKLDDTQLEQLRSNQLYIRSSLDIQCSADLFRQKVGQVIAKEVTISQALYNEIKDMLDQVSEVKIKDPSAVKNMSHLVLSDFYFKDIASLKMTNYGKLVIDESVSLELLDEKLVRLDNYGVVTCPEHLYSKVMQRTKANFGVIKAIKEDNQISDDAEDESGDVISGMGYYTC